MIDNDISMYLNFILYAVLGRLAEADVTMRLYGDSIRRAAARIRSHHRFSFERKTLHRGVLIDGEFDPSGREFVSWSESKDVATWFADPRSMMNEYVIGQRPRSVGYVLTSDAKHRVLFHHSWATRLGCELPVLASSHPDMGTWGARQLEWALKTQHEVITDPLDDWHDIWSAARPFVETGDTLDAQLAPPWLYRFARPCTFCHASVGEPCSTVSTSLSARFSGTHVERSWKAAQS